MVLLLPAVDKTLDESLSELTYENWKEWNAALSGRQLQVKLPRFKVEYNKMLIEDMVAMGMKDAFDGYKADFSKMSAAFAITGISESLPITIPTFAILLLICSNLLM